MEYEVLEFEKVIAARTELDAAVAQILADWNYGTTTTYEDVNGDIIEGTRIRNENLLRLNTAFRKYKEKKNKNSAS